MHHEQTPVTLRHHLVMVQQWSFTPSIRASPEQFLTDWITLLQLQILTQAVRCGAFRSIQIHQIRALAQILQCQDVKNPDNFRSELW